MRESNNIWILVAAALATATLLLGCGDDRNTRLGAENEPCNFDGDCRQDFVCGEEALCIPLGGNTNNDDGQADCLDVASLPENVISAVLLATNRPDVGQPSGMCLTYRQADIPEPVPAGTEVIISELRCDQGDDLLLNFTEPTPGIGCPFVRATFTRDDGTMNIGYICEATGSTTVVIADSITGQVLNNVELECE